MLHDDQLKTSSQRLDEFSRRIQRSETFDIEGAKYDISEHIFSVMEVHEVSKANLAHRLGKSRAYVTKILQGNANFTLESLVKIARALDCRLDVSHVLAPIHRTMPLHDWTSLAKHQRLGFRSWEPHRIEHEYIQLADPIKGTEEKSDNETLASAA